MSTGNIIIGIICVIAFIFPFVFIGRKGRMKKKGLKTSLYNYAGKHNFKIDQFETLDELALGIDSTNNVALITETINEEFVTRHVALDEIKTCQLNRKRRDVNSASGNESLLSQLDLSFYPRTKNDDVVSFLLYDENSGKRLGDELQLGVKWVEIYNGKKK